jgi:microcystin degradation protein MlrC
MNRPLRIAFGRINQETNALSPVTTSIDDFKAVHWLDEPVELLRRCQWRPVEVEGMFRNAELSGFVQALQKIARKERRTIEAVPLLSAWAVPSGPLTRACFDTLVETMCAKLRAAMADGDLDAVYLSLHGAMNVDGLPLCPSQTPESEIVRRVRDVVGDTVPVAISLDLHGNVGADLIARSNFIQGYQTNPHRDHAAVGARCARVLVDTVLGRVAPRMVWRSLPMILGGGNTVDFLKPLRAVFQRLKQLEDDDDILGITLMTVHPWNRHPELGWSVLVAVDDNRPGAGDVGDRAADELAGLAWAVRDQLPPTMKSPAEAITRARSRTWLRKTGVVVMSDASDVVSAGAPGENTALVKALIGATDLVSYCTLRDPELVASLWSHHRQVGDVVDVSLGCKLDPGRGERLTVTARIERLGTSHGMGRNVVLAIASVRLVVVEGPAMAVKPAYYKEAGLDPWKADVVVVKNFFPFLLFFAPLMRDVIFVKTDGVTDFDAAFTLTFSDPVSPRDPVIDWRDTDARRRALSATLDPAAPSPPSPASIIVAVDRAA